MEQTIITSMIASLIVAVAVSFIVNLSFMKFMNEWLERFFDTETKALRKHAQDLRDIVNKKYND